MTPEDHEAMSPRPQQGLSSRFQDFMRPGRQELLRSGLHDLWSLRVQELLILGHQVLMTSGYQDAKTSIRIDFLASLSHDGLSSRFIHSVLVQFCSRCQLRDRTVRLFRLAGEQVGTGRDIRPVFGGVRNIICFAPGKLCFPLREIDFVTENSLPARGLKTPPKSSFFTGATVARPEIWPAKDFRAPFARKQGRSGHFGEEKWRLIARIRLQNSPFSTDFRRLKMQNLDHSEPGLVPVFRGNSGSNDDLLRETTYRFAPQFQPAEDIERAGAAVRAEGIDTLFGHCGDGVVAGLGRLPTGPAGVADGKDQDALLGQGLFDGRRVATVESSSQGPDYRVAGFQQEFKDGFFERRLETADYDTVGCATRLGPAQGLFLDSRRDDA